MSRHTQQLLFGYLLYFEGIVRSGEDSDAAFAGNGSFQSFFIQMTSAFLRWS